MDKKRVIWSLFDSETAITQKLNNNQYEVYSIGLPSSSAMTDNFIKIDLSKKSCLKKLEKLPKPNIIFASPPCETWVNLSVGNVRFYSRNHNEYNLYWQRNFKPNDFTKKQRERRLLGQKTAFYTAKTIQKFKPEFWVIENGASSLIFKYLFKFHNLSGYKNLTRYNNYCDSFSEKVTVFYSNLKMNLKKKKIKSEHHISITKNQRDKVRKSNIWQEQGFSSPTAYLRANLKIKDTYCDRSRVPLKLYQHVLRIYENKEQLSLF